MFAMQTDTYSDTNCLFETLSQAKRHKPSLIITSLTVLTRVGHAYAEYANDADYAHMRNMRMRMRMKISSTLSTCKYLPKMATFWAKNGSAWLCFQF